MLRRVGLAAARSISMSNSRAIRNRSGISIPCRLAWASTKAAIRSSARRPAAERLEREILSSPAFKRIKEELGEEAFSKLAREKLSVLEIDLGRDGLGLTDAGREQLRTCEIVIHSAAAVEFDNPADLSAQTNLLGAARMVEALKATGSRPHLVHVSTAYVGGMLRGLVREEPPHDPGLNWRHEAAVLSNLRPPVEEESRRPEILKRLRRQAGSRMGPAGTPAPDFPGAAGILSALEELQSKGDLV